MVRPVSRPRWRLVRATLGRGLQRLVSRLLPGESKCGCGVDGGLAKATETGLFKHLHMLTENGVDKGKCVTDNAELSPLRSWVASPRKKTAMQFAGVSNFG